ncbi:hypothetical protein RUND412_002928 [Rhizina undulata]
MAPVTRSSTRKAAASSEREHPAARPAARPAIKSTHAKSPAPKITTARGKHNEDPVPEPAIEKTQGELKEVMPAPMDEAPRGRGKARERGEKEASVEPVPAKGRRRGLKPVRPTRKSTTVTRSTKQQIEAEYAEETQEVVAENSAEVQPPRATRGRKAAAKSAKESIKSTSSQPVNQLASDAEEEYVTEVNPSRVRGQRDKEVVAPKRRGRKPAQKPRPEPTRRSTRATRSTFAKGLVDENVEIATTDKKKDAKGEEVAREALFEAHEPMEIDSMGAHEPADNEIDIDVAVTAAMDAATNAPASAGSTAEHVVDMEVAQNDREEDTADDSSFNRWLEGESGITDVETTMAPEEERASGGSSQGAVTTEDSSAGAAVIPSRVSEFEYSVLEQARPDVTGRTDSLGAPPADNAAADEDIIPDTSANFSLVSGISEVGEKEAEASSLPPAAEDAEEKGGVIITPADSSELVRTAASVVSSPPQGNRPASEVAVDEEVEATTGAIHQGVIIDPAFSQENVRTAASFVSSPPTQDEFAPGEHPFTPIAANSSVGPDPVDSIPVEANIRSSVDASYDRGLFLLEDEEAPKQDSEETKEGVTEETTADPDADLHGAFDEDRGTPIEFGEFKTAGDDSFVEAKTPSATSVHPEFVSNENTTDSYGDDYGSAMSAKFRGQIDRPENPTPEKSLNFGMNSNPASDDEDSIDFPGYPPNTKTPPRSLDSLGPIPSLDPPATNRGVTFPEEWSSSPFQEDFPPASTVKRTGSPLRKQHFPSPAKRVHFNEEADTHWEFMVKSGESSLSKVAETSVNSTEEYEESFDSLTATNTEWNSYGPQRSPINSVSFNRDDQVETATVESGESSFTKTPETEEEGESSGDDDTAPFGSETTYAAASVTNEQADTSASVAVPQDPTHRPLTAGATKNRAKKNTWFSRKGVLPGRAMRNTSKEPEDTPSNETTAVGNKRESEEMTGSSKRRKNESHANTTDGDQTPQFVAPPEQQEK